MQLTITLTIAAAAALLNIWLMLRVGKVRIAGKVSVGDGGDENVIRRMRAHSNFIESAPLVLILIAAIEFSIGTNMVLWIVSALYILGRIGHGFGMDGGSLEKGRFLGTVITLLTLLGLAGWAIYISYTL